MRQGNLDKAELMYVRSIAIREEVFGTNHPNVAESCNNLAHVLRKKVRLI